MEKKLVLGIIGSGMIAEAHIKGAKRDSRIEIKWVNARTDKTINDKMQRFGIKHGTKDYHEILADDEVGAVIICTPPHMHLQMVKDSLNAGKHVLIEKPMCISKEELEELKAECKRHPNLLVMECSYRYTQHSPKLKYIKKMVDEDKLGDIYFIHYQDVGRQGRPGIEYNPGAYWFLDKAKAGGGPMFDWGMYDLGFHLGILNEDVELISADTVLKNGLDKVQTDAPVFDVEEHAISMMRFNNGLRLYYEKASNAHNEANMETRIYGTKGGLKFSFVPWGSNDMEYFYVDDDGKGKAVKEIITVEAGEDPGADAESSVVLHFAQCLLDGVECKTPVEKVSRYLDILFKAMEGF